MSGLRRWSLRIARRVGRRGAFLLFLALLDFAYGYSLYSAPRALVRSTDLLLSWNAWAVLWLIVGVICLTGVPIRNDKFQYTVSAAFKTAWGLLNVEIWLTRGQPSAWVAAIIWLAFAATVLLISGWPEPPIKIPEPVIPPGDAGEH